MTLHEAKVLAISRLKGHSDSPALDAGVLLSKITGFRREELVLKHKESLNPSQEKTFFDWIKERAKGLPVAYLTGKKEFMGLDFYVDQRVLIPRPDTEVLVEEALRLVKLRDRPQKILDVCTGSGAIILSMAAYLGTEHSFLGTDLSSKALEVAKINRETLGLSPVDLNQSDLLSNVPGKFDFILSNPPYLTPEETDKCLSKGWQEPRQALDGGTSGLEIPLRLIGSAVEKLYPNGYFMMEASDSQMPLLRESLAKAGFQNIRILKDLAGLRRVILGTR
jgi:release factor glutamine methyltransferase